MREAKDPKWYNDARKASGYKENPKHLRLVEHQQWQWAEDDSQVHIPIERMKIKSTVISLSRVIHQVTGTRFQVCSSFPDAFFLRILGADSQPQDRWSRSGVNWCGTHKNKRLKELSTKRARDGVTPRVGVFVFQRHVCKLRVKVSAVATTKSRRLRWLFQRYVCKLRVKVSTVTTTKSRRLRWLLLLLIQRPETTNFPLKHLLLNCNV